MDGPQQREYGDDVRVDSLSADLDSLQKELAQLDEALAMLDRKAHPLLTPAEEKGTVESDAVGTVRRSCSEIRHRLQAQTTAVRRVRVELASITDRLEV